MKRKIFFTITAFLVVSSSMAWTQYIYTPNGTPVWVIYPSELTARQIDSLNTTIANDYPDAVKIGDASSTYNCHSYAWNMVEGGPTAWLNAGDSELPNLSNYWTDGSYIETTATKAEKIYYYNGDHSAVPSETVPGMYESKWGQCPLVRHAPNYGPDMYNMSDQKYYIKNSYITGPTNLCFTGTYTVSNMPTGATVTWSVGNGLALVSGQGTTTAVVNQTGCVNNSTINATISRDGMPLSFLSYSVHVCNFSITGPSTLCSNSQYEIQGLPAGATITWQPGTGIYRVSPQGSNPCAFGLGASALKSSISAEVSYGGATLTLTRDNIWVGAPKEPNILASSNVTVEVENEYFTVTQGAQNVYFQMYNTEPDGNPNPLLDDWDWYGVNAMFKVWNFLDMGTDYYGVNYVTGYQYNSCSSPVEVNFVVEVVGNRSGDAGAGPELTLSPNPADKYVDIRIDFGDEEREPPSYVMEILNSSMYPVRNAVLSGGYNRVSVQGLQRGYYVVRIRYGDTVLTKPLMVE